MIIDMGKTQEPKQVFVIYLILFSSTEFQQSLMIGLHEDKTLESVAIV